MRAPLIRATLAAVALCYAEQATATDCLGPQTQLTPETATDHFERLFTEPVSCRWVETDNTVPTTMCLWQFSYRDPKAIRMADRLAEYLRICETGAELLPDDQRVNHPDTYFLTRLETPQGVYAVSLKDKAALGHSYVFFRFVPEWD